MSVASEVLIGQAQSHSRHGPSCAKGEELTDDCLQARYAQVWRSAVELRFLPAVNGRRVKVSRNRQTRSGDRGFLSPRRVEPPSSCSRPES